MVVLSLYPMVILSLVLSLYPMVVLSLGVVSPPRKRRPRHPRPHGVRQVSISALIMVVFDLHALIMVESFAPIMPPPTRHAAALLAVGAFSFPPI